MLMLFGVFGVFDSLIRWIRLPDSEYVISCLLQTPSTMKLPCGHLTVSFTQNPLSSRNHPGGHEITGDLGTIPGTTPWARHSIPFQYQPDMHRGSDSAHRFFWHFVSHPVRRSLFDDPAQPRLSSHPERDNADCSFVISLALSQPKVSTHRPSW